MITDILRFAYQYLEHPWILLGIFLLIPLTYIILKKDFLKLKEEPEVIKQKKKLRKIMLFTRTIIFACILIALASPYVQTDKTIKGDPFIQFIEDNSTSMALYRPETDNIVHQLRSHLNTEVKQAGSADTSNIGDAILSRLKPHSSVLVYTDGNANAGAELGDVALFAKKLNASISFIKPTLEHKDIGISIIGPSKTMEGSENTFYVQINRVDFPNPVPVSVEIDGENVYSETTAESVIPITRKLQKGTHKITATISATDHFPQNNIFYKTVRVVPQPKLLFLSEKSSPMLRLLEELYVVDNAGTLPQNLDEYYGVVINDIPANTLDTHTDNLNDYIAEGNGMIVFGGENSYEQGGYKDSLFETLLPIKVGSQEKKEGDIVIAVVIDVSGSTGSPFGRFKSTADFSKAATIGIIRGLRPDTRLSVIAFNSKAYLISEPSMVFEKRGIENTIARLKWGGSTATSAGLLKALSTIADFPGSKNIVLLSDGRPQNEAAALEAAKFAANMGTKIYTVGVGPTTNEQHMMDIAEISNGIYFRATEETKLNIIFGPVDEQAAQGSTIELAVLNANHFITAGWEPQHATVHGFNQAVPKSAGRLLITTTTADPILTTWRLGLGRVAALSTDDGGQWASSLLRAPNSELISRTVNWAIGDPERKSQSYIDAKDTRIREPTEIIIRAQTIPEAEGVTFYKVDEDLYSGTIIPQQTGYLQVAQATFAANYPYEYGDLGFSEELSTIAASTGGTIFQPNQIDAMVKFAETKANRSISSREYYRWPFIIIALSLFLLEIFIRRIVRKE